MIKVRGLQHTCLRRPAEQVTHRTSLYPFPCPGQRGHRRLQKLPLPQQPLCSVWSMARGPREALPTPQRRAPGPESRRGSIPAHVWSHRPSRGGHLLTPFDSPRLEVGKAACGRLLTPKSAGPTARPHEPLRLFTTRQLTSVVREHLPAFREGPAQCPPGSQGSGRVFLDRRPPRPVPLAVATSTSLQAAGPSVWMAQPCSQGSTVGGRIASRLLPLKWLLSDFWAPLGSWRTAAIPWGAFVT